MDRVQWWKQRLIEKKVELNAARETMIGSMVDKLKSIINRLDLSQQISLLERNLANSEVEAVTKKLEYLLSIIHQDDGQRTRELGLDESLGDAILRLYGERTDLDEARLLRLYGSEQLSDKTIAGTLRAPIAPPPGPPVIRVPRLGLACADGCNELCNRASGNVVCETCDKLYRQHPYCRGQVTMMTGVPEYFLHVGCDGRHLKL